MLTENTRLSTIEFGRQLDAKARKFGFGLHLDSTPGGRTRALSRAVVTPLFGRLETTTNCSYI
jgi:hypothetical protein